MKTRSVGVSVTAGRLSSVAAWAALRCRHRLWLVHPFLIKIAEDPDACGLAELTPERYAEQRAAYRASGKPNKTFPIDD